MSKTFKYTAKNGASFLVRKIVNLLNHYFAKKNLQSGFPQVAIYAFDHIGLKINNSGIYERDLLDSIMNFLEEQFQVSSFQTTIDIGANIGNHSLYFSKKSEVVFAFEPHPETYELLKFNTRNQNSIYTYNFGLSNQDQTLTLKNSSQNIGGASVSTAHNELSKKMIFDNEFSINLAMLDKQAELFERNISLIKIDVEGHEWEVIDGSKRLISLKEPFILFEMNSDLDFSKIEKIEKLLKSKNYIFYTINKNFEIAHGSKFKIISLILRVLFGEKYIIKKTSNLSIHPRPLVIAVPSKYEDISRLL